jgi:tape measure domain-containing protein
MPGIRIAVDASQVTQAARQADRGFDQIGRSARQMTGIINKASSGFGRMTNAVFSLKGAIVGLGLGYVARDFLDTAASFEQMELKLNALTRGRGTETLERINEWAKEMPVNTQKAVDAFTMLTAMGVDMGETLEDNIKFMETLTDVSVLFGEEALSRVARALGQITTLGKLSAEELNQLSESGINARKYLLEAFGTATAEEINKMGVTVEQVVDVIVRGLRDDFGGAAKDAMDTWQGVRSAFESNIIEIERQFAKAGVFDAIKDSMNEITEATQGWLEEQTRLKEMGLPNWFDRVADAASKMPGHIDSITSAISALVGSREFQLFTEQWELIAGAFVGMKFGGPVGALVGAAGGAAYSTYKDIRELFSDKTIQSGALPLAPPEVIGSAPTTPAPASNLPQKLVTELQLETQLLRETETVQRAMTLARKVDVEVGSEQYQQILEAVKAYEQAKQTLDERAVLMEEGARLTESMRTEQEIYNDTLAHLNKLLKAGAIDQTTYARAVAAAQEELTGARREQEALAEEGARLTESLRTAQERYNAEIAHLNKLLKAGAIDQTTYARAVEAAQQRILAQAQQTAGELTAIQERVFERFQDTTTDTFRAMLDDGLDSWETLTDGIEDLFKDTLASIAAYYASNAIILPIIGALNIPGISGVAQQQIVQSGFGGAAGGGIIGGFGLPPMVTSWDMLGLGIGDVFTGLGMDKTAMFLGSLPGWQLNVGTAALAGLPSLMAGDYAGAGLTTAGALLGGMTPLGPVGSFLGGIGGSLLGGIFGGGATPRVYLGGHVGMGIADGALTATGISGLPPGTFSRQGASHVDYTGQWLEVTERHGKADDELAAAVAEVDAIVGQVVNDFTSWVNELAAGLPDELTAEFVDALGAIEFDWTYYDRTKTKNFDEDELAAMLEDLTGELWEAYGNAITAAVESGYRQMFADIGVEIDAPMLAAGQSFEALQQSATALATRYSMLVSVQEEVKGNVGEYELSLRELDARFAALDEQFEAAGATTAELTELERLHAAAQDQLRDQYVDSQIAAALAADTTEEFSSILTRAADDMMAAGASAEDMAVAVRELNTSLIEQILQTYDAIRGYGTTQALGEKYGIDLSTWTKQTWQQYTDQWAEETATAYSGSVEDWLAANGLDATFLRDWNALGRELARAPAREYQPQDIGPAREYQPQDIGPAREYQPQDIGPDLAAQEAERIAALNSLWDEFELSQLDDYSRGLEELRRQWDNLATTAAELGASEEQLASIRAAAADEIKAYQHAEVERRVLQARQDLIGAYDREIESLRDQIAAEEELASARIAIVNAEIVSYQDAVTAAQDEIERLREAMRPHEDLVRQWQSISDAIAAATSGISDLGLTAETTVKQSAAEFNRAMQAAFAGDVEGARELSSAATDYARDLMQTSATSAEYRYQLATMRAQLHTAGVVVDLQATTEELILATLEDQLGQQEATIAAAEEEIALAEQQIELYTQQLDQSVEALTTQVEYYQQQVDYLSSIDQHIISLADALANYAAQMATSASGTPLPTETTAPGSHLDEFYGALGAAGYSPATLTDQELAQYYVSWTHQQGYQPSTTAVITPPPATNTPEDQHLDEFYTALNAAGLDPAVLDNSTLAQYYVSWTQKQGYQPSTTAVITPPPATNTPEDQLGQQEAIIAAAEEEIALAEQQIELYTQQLDQSVEALTTQVEYYQQQVDYLSSIDQHIISLADALANYDAQMATSASGTPLPTETTAPGSRLDEFYGALGAAGYSPATLTDQELAQSYVLWTQKQGYQPSTTKGYASGGIATGPNTGYPALLHGTEAIIPLSGGRGIPVEIDNGALIREVAAMRSEMRAIMAEAAIQTKKVASMTKRWEKIGMPTTRAA